MSGRRQSMNRTPAQYSFLPAASTTHVALRFPSSSFGTSTHFPAAGAPFGGGSGIATSAAFFASPPAPRSGAAPPLAGSGAGGVGAGGGASAEPVTTFGPSVGAGAFSASFFLHP